MLRVFSGFVFALICLGAFSYWAYQSGYISLNVSDKLIADDARSVSNNRSEELIIQEATDWAAASTEDTIEGYEYYLEKYPNGEYAGIAQLKIVELRSNPEIKAQRAEKQRDLVRKAQQELNRLGFPVEVDGVAGKKTVEAIESFQRAAGLDVNGLVEDELLIALSGKSSCAIEKELRNGTVRFNRKERVISRGKANACRQALREIFDGDVNVHNVIYDEIVEAENSGYSSKYWNNVDMSALCGHQEAMQEYFDVENVVSGRAAGSGLRGPQRNVCSCTGGTSRNPNATCYLDLNFRCDYEYSVDEYWTCK